MKIKVNINCGNDTKSYYISCGRGDKTFKWLGMVASQRFALTAPNGAIRRRDSDNPHAISNHAQQLPYDIKLKNGESLHPSALIVERLKDGDEVFCTLGARLDVDGVGTPSMTKWATTAFSGIDNNLIQDSKSNQDDSNHIDTSVSHQAKAQFMKVILASQMFDYKKIEDKLITAWEDIPILLPRLTNERFEQLRQIFHEYAIILFEIFDHYTASLPNSQMDFQTFQLFIEDSEIFPQRDLIKLTQRIFQHTSHSKTLTSSLTLTEFIVSLIYTSQLRYNDTLDESTTLNNCHDALIALFQDHLILVAKKLSLDCLLRLEFNSNSFLYQLKEFHHDLFAVFEFYSNKMQRDLPLTLTNQLMLEIFYQSGLVDSTQDTYQNNQMLHTKYIKLLHNNMIIGRTTENNLYGPTETTTKVGSISGSGSNSVNNSARSKFIYYYYY